MLTYLIRITTHYWQLVVDEVGIQPHAFFAHELAPRNRVVEAAGADQVGREHVPVEVVVRRDARAVSAQDERRVGKVRQRLERDRVHRDVGVVARARRAEVIARLRDGRRSGGRVRLVAHKPHNGTAAAAAGSAADDSSTAAAGAAAGGATAVTSTTRAHRSRWRTAAPRLDLVSDEFVPGDALLRRLAHVLRDALPALLLGKAGGEETQRGLQRGYVVVGPVGGVHLAQKAYLVFR